MPTMPRATTTSLAWALVMALASAAPAIAQEPLAVFKAPERSAVGETIILDARGSKSNAPLEWFVDGPKGVEKTAPDPKREMGLILDPPLGTYRVFLIAVDGAGKKHMAFRTIEVAPKPPGAAVVPPCPPAPRAYLTGPDYLSEGADIILDARKSRSVGPIIWKVEGPRNLVASFDPDAKDGPRGSLGVIFGAPAGDYVVTATATGADGTAPDVSEPHVIHVSDMAPLLIGVHPAGYAGQINAVLLVDLANIPAAHSSVVVGNNLHPYQRDGNFSYQIQDVRAPGFNASAFNTYLNGFIQQNTGTVWKTVSTPALLLYDQSGRVLTCEPAPTTPQAIASKIRLLRLKMGKGG